jgi:hypothetical protein
MSAVLIIITAIGICLLLLGYFALLARVYYKHVKGKGYLNPLIVLVFPLTILLALIAGLVALALGHHSDNPAYVSLYLLGPVILATAVLYAGARSLPRKARVAGTRKIIFPYRLAGWIVFVAGVAQFLLFGFGSGWKTQTMSQSGKLLFWIVLPATFYCLYLAKRAHAPSAAEILNADPRPPVLYLRPFTLEERYFVVLPGSEASKYTSLVGTKIDVTLEQYFGEAIRQHIGPFVALGNPLDYAPPEGAARTYERDENWKQRFVDLARKAACIIVQVGESRNLQWEFQALKLDSLQEKVFIFTPPRKKVGFRNRLGQKFLNMALRLKGAGPTAWPDFAEGLRCAGYELDPIEPSPGSILSFGREGSAILLATDAQDPEDFLAVVLERLAGPIRAA